MRGVEADLEKQLLRLEEQFWKGNVDFYRHNLTEDALMVFQEPVGILARDTIVESLAGSQRWAEVRFRDVHLLRLTDKAAVVTYEASARRGGEPSRYSAFASSVYVKRDGSWVLAFHQQTPGSED